MYITCVALSYMWKLSTETCLCQATNVLISAVKMHFLTAEDGLAPADCLKWTREELQFLSCRNMSFLHCDKKGGSKYTEEHSVWI